MSCNTGTALLRQGYTSAPIKMKQVDGRFAEYTIMGVMRNFNGIEVKTITAEKISDTEWHFFKDYIPTEKKGIYTLEVSATKDDRIIYIGTLKIRIQ